MDSQLSFDEYQAVMRAPGGAFTDGERHLVEFIYDKWRMGSFYRALMEAMFLADRFNLDRLGMGFPSEALAVEHWTMGTLRQQIAAFTANDAKLRAATK